MSFTFSKDYSRFMNGTLPNRYGVAMSCGYDECASTLWRIDQYETYAWLRDSRLKIITYFHVDCAYKVAQSL